MRSGVTLAALTLALLLGLGLAASSVLASCHEKQTDCLIDGNMGGKSAGKVWYDRCWSWKHARCQFCGNGNDEARKCLKYQPCRDQAGGCWVCFWDNIWHTSSTCYSGPPSGQGLTRQGGSQ